MWLPLRKAQCEHLPSCAKLTACCRRSASHTIGIPTYNEAREAYGFARASSFSGVTDDVALVNLLDAAYEGDIELLDAVTGALAEGSNSSSSGILGDLLKVRLARLRSCSYCSHDCRDGESRVPQEAQSFNSSQARLSRFFSPARTVQRIAKAGSAMEAKI